MEIANICTLSAVSTLGESSSLGIGRSWSAPESVCSSRTPLMAAGSLSPAASVVWSAGASSAAQPLLVHTQARKRFAAGVSSTSFASAV